MRPGSCVVVCDMAVTPSSAWCWQPVSYGPPLDWTPLQCCVPADGSAHAVIVSESTVVAGIPYGTFEDGTIVGGTVFENTIIENTVLDSSVVGSPVEVESRAINPVETLPAESGAPEPRSVLPLPTAPPVASGQNGSAQAAAEPLGLPPGTSTPPTVVEKPMPLPSATDAPTTNEPLLPASGEQPMPLQPIESSAEQPAGKAAAGTLAEQAAEELSTDEKPGEETAAETAPAEPEPPMEETPEAEEPAPKTDEPAVEKPAEGNLFDEVGDDEEEEAEGAAAMPPASAEPAPETTDEVEASPVTEEAEPESPAADASATEDDAAEDEDMESTDPEPSADEPAESAPGESEPAEEKEANPFSSILRTPNEPTRRWTDDTGLHETIGTLVEVHPDRIRILKTNGKRASVPLKRLSHDDKAYVAETGARVAAQRQAPRAPGPVETAGL
jgi:hypothetical protein